MMLRTGNDRGFTFIEAMLATGILALGAVLIYEAFFISLDAFNYYTDYLNASSWADNMLWQAQEKLVKAEPFSPDGSGQLIDNNKVFHWKLAYNLIDEQAGLYLIDLSISWKTGKRGLELLRSTYGLLQQQ